MMIQELFPQPIQARDGILHIQAVILRKTGVISAILYIVD